MFPSQCRSSPRCFKYGSSWHISHTSRPQTWCQSCQSRKMRNRNLVTINHHFRAHTHTKKKSSMQTPHFVGKILTRDSINSPQPAGVLKTERVSWAIWTRINQRTWRHYRVKISYRGGTPPSLISRIQLHPSSLGNKHVRQSDRVLLKRFSTLTSIVASIDTVDRLMDKAHRWG